MKWPPAAIILDCLINLSFSQLLQCAFLPDHILHRGMCIVDLCLAVRFYNPTKASFLKIEKGFPKYEQQFAGHFLQNGYICHKPFCGNDLYDSRSRTRLSSLAMVFGPGVQFLAWVSEFLLGGNPARLSVKAPQEQGFSPQRTQRAQRRIDFHL
jgi:hypothetical protein